MKRYIVVDVVPGDGSAPYSDVRERSDGPYMLYEDHAKAISENSRWIPVGERLPTDDEWDNLYATDGKSVVPCWIDDEGRFRRHDESEAVIANVTHWMPPSPPPAVEGVARVASSIVTAPADDGKGRISAYDTTWPDVHSQLHGSEK